MNKIDLSYLQEITGGDSEIMAEMVDLFLTETPKHLKNLKVLLANEQWVELGAEAHKLKPTLSYVGLTELNEKAQKIEYNGKKQENLDQVPGLIEAIEAGFHEVKDDLIHKKEELLSR